MIGIKSMNYRSALTAKSASHTLRVTADCPPSYSFHLSQAPLGGSHSQIRNHLKTNSGILKSNFSGLDT